MTQFWRNSLLTSVALFLETCTFYLVFGIVTSLIQLPEARVAFALTFLTLLLSFLLSMYIQTIRFSLDLRGSLGLVLSLFSLVFLSHLNSGSGLVPFGEILNGDLITAAITVLGLISLVVLWWRGTMIAHDDITLDTLRGTFQWGLAMVFASVLIDALTPAEVINGFLIMGFFAVGLVGLAMARFAAESGQSQFMSKDWFIPICITVGGVLLLGLLISLLGLGGLDDVTRAIFGFAGQIGLWIMRPILLFFGLLAAGLIWLGEWLTSVFGGGDLSTFYEAQAQLREFQESMQEVEQRGPPSLLVALLKWSAFLAGLAVTVWVLFKVFRFRRLLRNTGEVEETRESLFTWDRANQDISAMISGWLNNLARLTGRDSRQRPDPRNAREVYHSFLALSDEVGHPKDLDQTPKEHQHQLGWTLPPEPVAHIVDGFQGVHYGHSETDDRQMHGLLQDWAGLQRYVTERERVSGDQTDDENKSD